MNRSAWERVDFSVSEKESDFLHENSKKAYKVQVAGHELFGHGSGKLVYKENGKCPQTFTDPVTKEKYSSCYNKGETYQTKFGEFSTSYEECRADLSGLYLQTFEPMYGVFGYT